MTSITAVVLTMGTRPEELNRGIKSLLAQQDVELDIVCVGNGWDPEGLPDSVTPVYLPENRRVRVDYPLGWFSIRKIRVVDLPVQADTYLACGLLSETISHLVDTFVPDYLVERVEEMLDHRVLTGYYPRLTLGEHQRFASKGGYLVRFAAPTGTRVVAASDWLIP